MAKLLLYRFSTLEKYRNAALEDGTFFVIVESGQLGVRKGDIDILTPPNTLFDYELPEGDVVNPDVIMTTETNPAVMNVLITNGLLPEGREYLLKSEAASFTEKDLQIDENKSIFTYNSEVTNFDEFEYFTGITELQYNCFASVSKLSSIKLPSSLTTINRAAFSNVGLKTIYTNNISYLDPDAFTYSKQLVDIQVDGNSRTYFSEGGCVYLIDYSDTLYLIAPGLTEYTMPDFVEAVYKEGDVVWKNGANLTKVTLNSVVAGVYGKWFLYGFDKLVEVTGPEDHPDVSFYNGCIYSKDYSELVYYPSAKVYSEDLLHENITKFGDYSFVQHKKLTEFTVPSNITEIGTWAFYNVSATKIVIHENVGSLGNQCFSWNSKLTAAEVNTPNLTGSSIFAYCNKLTDITLSPLTSSLPNNLFSSCSALATIDIPENVTVIRTEVFSNCSKLAEITIPAGVTSLGNSCFSGCTSLGEINSLPSTAPTLGTEVFGATSNNYTGSKATSKNLYVPSNASGYNSGDWLSVLQDTVGFTINYTL